MATSYPPLANGSYQVGAPAQPFPSRTPGPPPQGSLPPGGVYWHGMARPTQQPQPQPVAPQAPLAQAPQAPLAQAPTPSAPYPQVAAPQAPFVPAPQPVAPFVPAPPPQPMTTGTAAFPGAGSSAPHGPGGYVELARPVAPTPRQWSLAAGILAAVVVFSVLVLVAAPAEAATMVLER